MSNTLTGAAAGCEYAGQRAVIMAKIDWDSWEFWLYRQNRVILR